MKAKRPIPLNLALISIEFKHKNGLLADGTPLWQRLLGEGKEKKRPHRDAATVKYDPEIAERPINMNEALQRQHLLAEWLQEGNTLDDFIRKFGPEK